jgi:hypothetical protein
VVVKLEPEGRKSNVNGESKRLRRGQGRVERANATRCASPKKRYTAVRLKKSVPEICPPGLYLTLDPIGHSCLPAILRDARFDLLGATRPKVLALLGCRCKRDSVLSRVAGVHVRTARLPARHNSDCFPRFRKVRREISPAIQAPHLLSSSRPLQGSRASYAPLQNLRSIRLCFTPPLATSNSTWHKALVEY